MLRIAGAMTNPPLCLGLPVYNGEKYLASAVDSLLAQRFGDFRLNLVDNASTDATRDICETFVEKDSRVRYFRNDENIGAVRNWYRAFDLSTSDYFKWAAHDDLYHPDFLGRCMEGLQARPQAAICYSRFTIIDEHSQVVRNFDVEIDTGSAEPHVRLYNMISVDYLCVQFYGVIRSSIFRQVRRYAGYFGWDRNVLAEIALRGEVYEVPEYLFLHRLHPDAWGAALLVGRPLEDLLKYDPTINWSLDRSGVSVSGLVRFKNFLTAVAEAPLDTREKLRCYLQLGRIAGEQTVSRTKRGFGRLGRVLSR
jgi:glycosyltransferase involved in cell wall biosynthesis